MNLISKEFFLRGGHKAALLTSVFALSLSVSPLAAARNNVSPDTLAAEWAHVSVSAGVKKDKATIQELLSAFNRHWPTGVFNRLLNEDKGVMDIKNGYAEAQFHNPDTDSVETGAATIWRRKNGHTLLGITIDRNISDFGTKQIVLFYDYDPATGTLTPDPKYNGCAVPLSHAVFRQIMELPRQGRNIEVAEFNPKLSVSLRHTCTFDGMKHKYASTVLESDVDFVNSLPASAREYDADLTPRYYYFTDIDRDGFPELWLSDLTGDYQQMFSVKESTELLGWNDYKTHFRFYPGVLTTSGGCGTMCFLSVYTVIKDSRAESYLNEITSGDFEGNEIVTYSSGNLDDGYENTSEVDVREGAEQVRAFGLAYDEDPEWREVKQVVVRNRQQ